MNVMLFGSTGMVGRGILLECIDNPDVVSVLVINRRPIDVHHPKVKEIILEDFFNIHTIRESLSGYTACFYSMGITSLGANEADYARVMYDVPVLIGKELLSLNPDMVFCFVSGKATDSSEKGTIMWARVKGKAENALLAMGFRDAYMFRPGHIQPKRGIKSRTGWYNIYYAILGKIYFLLKHLPGWVTDTDTLAKAMIYVVKKGYHKKILESVDINSVGK